MVGRRVPDGRRDLAPARQSVERVDQARGDSVAATGNLEPGLDRLVVSGAAGRGGALADREPERVPAGRAPDELGRAGHLRREDLAAPKGFAATRAAAGAAAAGDP